jgi:tight adherence protein C
MQSPCPVLAAEMRRVEVEASIGLGWNAALDRASARTGVPSFRSLGSLVGQSVRFGTELAKVLEVLSDSLRLETMQSLEERAHKASVRLLVPLGTLLLPATLVVFVGPLFILLLEALQTVNAD